MQAFDELGISQGFLTDRLMRVALDAGYLIDPGTWKPDLIRHASYSLRLGDRIEIADAAHANQDGPRNFTERHLREGEYLEFKPGETAKLYSAESLRLPNSVLAFTVARGLMFVESLVPENTYVDPGFAGTIYTTVCNFSNRIVRLHYGDPIARLFFYHLSEDVQERYVRGAAKGLKQQLDSFRATKLGTAEERRAARRRDILMEVRAIPLTGNKAAELADRQFRWLVMLAAFALLWPVFLSFANTNQWLRQRLGSIFSEVLALLGSALLSKGADLLLKRVVKS